MGQDHSTPASAEPRAAEKADKLELLMQLQRESGFAQSQVEELFKHFQRIAGLREDDGVVSKAEFLDVLQAKPSVLLDRMFALFDHDNSGTIDFREFLVGLAILCDRASREDKLKFCFKMYDLDNDGFITRGELYKNALALPPDVLARIVDTTFAKADTDGDGRITEEEFAAYVIENPAVIDQLTVHSDSLQAARSITAR